ncbi:MAG: trigger factor [Clostridia bacterium]|nr:trigger factor [Clostridia bacterium]
MSVKVEKTDKTNEVKLEFTVEAAKFEEAIQTVYKKSAKYFKIPGFRNGKAPFKMVEKMYGIQIFYEDAFNEVASKVYEEGIKEAGVEVVSKPEIDITQIEAGKDLIFTAVVQTKPEVELGKYKGIEIKKHEYTVSDEDVEHELGHMAEKNARIVTVEDRPVENNDITVIDFEGFVDGKAFEGGKAENYELTIGSNSFIPGFENQIIGMKIDEERDIKVKFPEEYFSKELAGKDATFKIKLHEIKKKEMPEINDELAKDISEFDTIDELKKSIRESKEKQNETQAKYETEDDAIETVCENAKVEIPSGMIETEIENMEKDMESRLSYQGMKLDDYLQMIGKTREQFKEEYKPQAEKQVKTRLVLEAIANDAKIEVTEEEIQAKIAEMAKMYGQKEEEVKNNEHLRNYVKENLKTEKTIEFIVSNAKIK